jgi:hypothetical protein
MRTKIIVANIKKVEQNNKRTAIQRTGKIKTTECKHEHEHSWDAAILKSVIPIRTKKIIAMCIVIALMGRSQVDNNSPYVSIILTSLSPDTCARNRPEPIDPQYCRGNHQEILSQIHGNLLKCWLLQQGEGLMRTSFCNREWRRGHLFCGNGYHEISNLHG